ncbi:MAG: hypothetical protein EOO52_15850 [Gammaproteobacteria bacterium]|nr:MAG: hypothetical protein EOO52_15850 [Gammaproteobacteria bacterium]
MASDDFPQLHEHKSFSQNYEIVKLIDGPIDTVYSVNSSGDFIVQNGLHLWKVNASGEVIDYFVSSGLYSSGLIIEEEGVIDWVFTGDKELKSYVKTVDAKTYSEKELFDAFDQADIIEFNETYGSKGEAYLYKDGQAWVLDIANQKDKIEDFYLTQETQKKHNLRRQQTSVRVSEFKGYQKKAKSFNFLVQSNNNSLQPWKMTPVGFKKQTTHREFSVLGTFLENLLSAIFGSQGGHDYGYPIGYTKFELSHENESIKFSIFSDKKFGEDIAANFAWLGQRVPSNNDTTFIAVNYRAHNLTDRNEESLLPYYEKDIGIHAIRKKTAHSRNLSSAAWQLSYSGLRSYNFVWGHTHFAEETLHPIYYWFHKPRVIVREQNYWTGLDNQISSPILKTIPKSITFHWTAFRPDSSFRLMLNGRDKVFPASRDLEVALTLTFDAVELAQAFQKLGSSTGLIQLNLHMEEKPWGAELLIHLQNAKQKIPLEKAFID